MFISVDTEKPFVKTQQLFMIKIPANYNRGGVSFSDKNIYKKSSANIILNGENLDLFC